MANVVAMTVFAGAMALALMVIWSTVAPQWRRIVRLAAGGTDGTDMPFQPSADLASAGSRIVVSRWAAASVVVAPRRLRAAA